MTSAREDRAADALSVLLAGLQAGVIGVSWMLAWLGTSAAWHRSSFWTAENLLASTFYGSAAIRSGFSRTTVTGLALYFVLYGLLGGLFAVVVPLRLAQARLFLLSVAAALLWYYASFHGIWKSIGPLVVLLHAEQPTILGHVIYGAILSRFPRYLPPAPHAPDFEALAPAGAPEAEHAPDVRDS
jgi:hypothetical protein